MPARDHGPMSVVPWVSDVDLTAERVGDNPASRFEDPSPAALPVESPNTRSVQLTRNVPFAPACVEMTPTRLSEPGGSNRSESEWHGARQRCGGANRRS